METAYWAVASFAFFLYFDKKVSPSLSAHIPDFKKLTKNQKIEWHARCCSTVHAVTVTIIAIYALLFDSNIKEDLLWGRSIIGECNIAIVVGFLLSDICLMAIYFEAVGGTWMFVLHHVVAAYAYIYGLLGMPAENMVEPRKRPPLPIPDDEFPQLWVLSATGNKHGALYYYNGILLVLSFFVSRILPMPYFWYTVLEITRLEGYSRMSWTAHISWILVCFILDTLNIIWMRKMTLGMYKHLGDLKSREKVGLAEPLRDENTIVAKLD